MRKRAFVGVLFCVLAAACSHGRSGGGGMLPSGSAAVPVTPQSVSPGTITAPPMAKTEILPPSAMKSPLHPDIAQPPLSWTPIPGTATAVAASPDGSLWVLSDQPNGSQDKYIWHYASGAWSNISGLASNISIAPDGTVWAINSAGGIYHYVNGNWSSPGGGASNSITADPNGGVYVLSNSGAGPDRAIWHYSMAGGWAQQNGSGTALAANWDTNTFPVAPVASGTVRPNGVYILNSAGNIWYENSDLTFVQFPGAATAITPTTNGGFFVLSYPISAGGNEVYYFDLNSPGFAAQNGAGLLSISAGSNLYLTSASGALYSAPLPAFGPVSTAVVTSSGSTSGSITLGTPKTFTLSVVEKDVNGKTITGTYANPITLSNLDITGSTMLNVTTVTSSSTPVTLTYNGSSSFTGTRVRAFINSGATAIGSFLVTGPCTLTPGVSRQGYYPCDLQSAYNLTSSSATGGSGQTVAIVDAFDDPTAESDLAAYRSAFGLPPCTSANGCFIKRAQDGSTNYPQPDSGWAGEISLDLDMVSAICPNCHILLIEATTDSASNMFAAENEAPVLGATEISNSWGLTESSGILHAEVNFNHPGIPITASSGDDGFSGGVSYPASSAFVTAVGGTALVAATNTRGWSETAWGGTQSNDGGGSGCSDYIAKPSWQTDTGCTQRMVSDVAADADPNTAVWTYDTYQSSAWVRVGGTSAAAPMIAAVYAISGNAASVVYGSYPYLHPSGLNDIISGTNAYPNDPTCGGTAPYYCNAQAGYDGPTGLGTPNGATTSFIRPQRQSEPVPLNSSNYHPGPYRHLCAAPTARRAACFALLRTD